jgi:hypothetical protein
MVLHFWQHGHGTNGSKGADATACADRAGDGEAAFLLGRFPSEELAEASMEAGESRELGKKALGTKKLETEYL